MKEEIKERVYVFEVSDVRLLLITAFNHMLYQRMQKVKSRKSNWSPGGCCQLDKRSLAC